MTIVDMCVSMDCSGCVNKIRKALLKLDGVDEVDIDMARQKVTVTGWVDQKKVLKTVRKTGRKAVLWPYTYGTEHATYTQEYYHDYQPTPGHHLISNANSNSYNYRVHGYVNDADVHGYYRGASSSSSSSPHLFSHSAGSMFSDDNPNACSIM
ncbi:heavy metal-associated isoprenylated plant protein 28-like [Typha latifolia]|uniref:heavy metal-associated isoprenylated plant protein 28-like n=1 Tax=Typha latifolia TaxID=4733 RepID=UPI003C2F76DE